MSKKVTGRADESDSFISICTKAGFANRGMPTLESRFEPSLVSGFIKAGGISPTGRHDNDNSKLFGEMSDVTNK